MRLGGRLAAAIEVLDDIERRRRPAADALKDWGLSHRFAGSGDRGAIGNIVYDALRRKRSAAWLFGSHEPRALAFGALLLEWGLTPQAITAALDGDRFAPPFLAEAELAALAGNDLADAPDAVRGDVPEWSVPLFQAAFGPDWVGEAAALAGRPPLDLRVNTLKSDRERVLGELRHTGAQPFDLVPTAVRIPPVAGDGRHPNVQAEPAFQKGWFEVQDAGSQAVAMLAGAAPGMQVLDYCAGAGGKTLAMSAAMNGSGQVFAYDSDKARLAPIFDRMRRADTRNVQTVTGPGALEPLAGQMDLVLVDAPCTGSGTWRRRPDAKWRLGERQLGVRIAEQTAILQSAARYVKPGGRLVYITCSVFEAENGERIGAFLGDNDHFEPVDHAELWQTTMSAPASIARFGRSGLNLTPARSGTDGFFVSVLERSG